MEIPTHPKPVQIMPRLGLDGEIEEQVQTLSHLIASKPRLNGVPGAFRWNIKASFLSFMSSIPVNPSPLPFYTFHTSHNSQQCMPPSQASLRPEPRPRASPNKLPATRHEPIRQDPPTFHPLVSPESEPDDDLPIEIKYRSTIDHEARKVKIFEILKPIVSDDIGISPVILLCSGHQNSCLITPVRISNSEDGVTTWREIRRAWFDTREGWRRHLGLFLEIKEVDIVNISMAGRSPNRKYKALKKFEFHGTYSKTNLEEEKRQIQQNIADYTEQEWPCSYDIATGGTLCDRDCVSGIIDVDCPERKLFKNQRRLGQLNLRPFLRLAFTNPEFASANDLLKDEDVIYGHRDLLEIVDTWHCPQLGELPFRGLLIDETWSFCEDSIVFPLISAALIALVISSRLLYGDWGTAWNVGSFFISLAAFWSARSR